MSPPHASPEPAVVASPPCVTPQAEQERWFEQEVHAHDRMLKSYLRNRFPSIRDVEDLAQESYLRIWRIRAVTKFESAKSFLFKIAHHLALDQVRRNQTVRLNFPGDSVLDSVMEDKPDAADLLTEQEKIDLVTDAVVALPARTREIFLLVRFKGHRQQDVADQLGLTRKAVEHQLARGVELCEKYLRAHGYELF
jgi:RNA polymerase sigma-70 factor (ECF subfamily)